MIQDGDKAFFANLPLDKTSLCPVYCHKVYKIPPMAD
jgi:hypothetical protein